jgi:hypothetical protein
MPEKVEPLTQSRRPLESGGEGEDATAGGVIVRRRSRCRSRAATGRPRGADPCAVRHRGPGHLPEMGTSNKELMPNCHLVYFVYDAGGAIATDWPEAFTEVVTDPSSSLTRPDCDPPLTKILVRRSRAARLPRGAGGAREARAGGYRRPRRRARRRQGSCAPAARTGSRCAPLR